uniref:Uncharacterized protein n=1 Tax=Arundo donax TaxID=35708 RepID=A0A0A9BWQ1_ARUDO
MVFLLYSTTSCMTQLNSRIFAVLCHLLKVS